MKTSSILTRTDRPVRAWHERGVIHVELEAGQKLSFPVSGSQRLSKGTAKQLNHIELLPWTLHWPDLDEDLTIESIQRGELG